MSCSSPTTYQSLSWPHCLVDLTVDGIFVLFPIITLWKVKLPRNLHRIIIFAFSGSALTLITGIVFCILGYNTNLNLGSVTQTIVRLASHLEVCLSLCTKCTYINRQFSGSCCFDGRQFIGYSVVPLSYLHKDPTRPWTCWSSNHWHPKITSSYGKRRKQNQWLGPGKGNVHRPSVCVRHRRQAIVIHTDTVFAAYLVINAGFRTSLPSQWRYVCLLMFYLEYLEEFIFKSLGKFVASQKWWTYGYITEAEFVHYKP